jgi:hypothetical protein
MASVRRRLNEIMAEELTKRIGQAMLDLEMEGIDVRLPEEATKSIHREILTFLGELQVH